MNDADHRRAPTFRADLAASLVVAVFSLAVVVGFARVFSGWPFMRDLTVVVIAGHGVGLVLRRLRLTAWLAVPTMAAALAWTVLALHYRDTFSWAMPTSETWSLLQQQLAAVRNDFATTVAPVVYGGGWDVLAAIGAATAVFLADVFAFRADARAETLVPGGVLFVFVGALGDDRLRIGSAVLVVAVGVATTAVLRSYHGEPTRPAAAESTWGRWPAVAALAIVVALAAGVVGPRLPGADAAALYETNGRGGGVTEVLSPLVDIRSRLTNQSTTELFRIRADVESYWRSTALPDFDGNTWRLPERDLQRVDDDLAAPRPGRLENRQQITIGTLGGSLVPAAPDPFQATGPDDLRWVAETSTLVTIDDDLTAGDVIDIVSATPRLGADTLAGATSAAAGDPIYTSVPDDLPVVVEDTARRLTENSQSPFESAIALQQWFQSEFTYSLDVQPGHDGSAIETFLRDRVGYCEQFAGTYAAMMRTLGIPARVAVGFTSGATVSDGVYSVLGRNAHAWPEVWFDGIGWVTFEPTPGRGAPNAEGYTGLAAQQDLSGADAAADGDDPTPTTTLPFGPDDDQLELNIPEEFDDPAGAAQPSSGGDNTSTGASLPWTWVLLLLIVAAVVGSPAVIRWWRTRMAPQSGEQQIARAWRRASGAVHDLGVPADPSQTPSELATTASRQLPVIARPIRSLADAVTEAAYSGHGVATLERVGAYGSSSVADCRHWAKQIDRAVTESLPLTARIRRYFSVWR